MGEHISKFTSLDAIDRIVATGITDDFEKSGELIISTKKGMIKRSSIKEFNISKTKRGSKYINLKENDKVVSVVIMEDKDSFVTSVTKNGYAVKYIADNLTNIGLGAAGVKNMNITDGDKVASTVVNTIKNTDDGEAQVLFVTNNGKAKRLRVKDIKPVSRGSKGSLIASQSKSNPYKVINTFNVHLTDHIYILTDNDEILNLKPKGEILITDTKNGLTKLTKQGNRLSFNDLTLNFDKLEKYSETKKNEKIQKSIQLDLDSILDEF